MFYKLYTTSKLEDCNFEKHVINSLYDQDIILIKHKVGQTIFRHKAVKEFTPPINCIYSFLSELCYNHELSNQYTIKDVNHSTNWLDLYARSNYSQFILTLLAQYRPIYCVAVEDKYGEEIVLYSDGRVMIDNDNINNNIYLFKEFLKVE